MAARTLWVGLDVGADSMAVCGTDSHGNVMFEHSLPTSAAAFNGLLKAEKRRIRLIALESCSFAVPLTRSLRKLGYRVAVFDSRQASKFLAIRKNKTDKNDARGLAELARLGCDAVSEVRVKSVECQRLRSTLITRQRLVSLRTTVEGSIRSLFRLNGGHLKSSSNLASFNRNVASQLRAIRKLSKIDLRDDVEPLLALSNALRTYLVILDEKLSRMAEDHPICRRFLEIKGIGPLCALSFYSAVDDPTRFRRNADIGPYLGMVPVVRQSGQSTSRGRISKRGDALTRAYLTNAAVLHLRFATSAMNDWGVSLTGRMTNKKAQVAVARKLAVTMLAMWKSGQRYDPYHRSSATNAVVNDNPLLIS